MRSRRTVIGAIALVAAAAVAVVAVAVATVTRDDDETHPIGRWLSVGDSYVSGEGLTDADEACGRSPRAWVAAAQTLVARQLGVSDFVNFTCSGARVPEVEAQVDLGLAQLPPGERFDLVTVSVGGNDSGFSALILDCIGLDALVADPAATAPEAVATALTRRCDTSVEDLRVRTDSVKTRLATLYDRIVTQALAPGGRLVVFGYPALFEPPDRWAPRQGEHCDTISRPEVEFLAEAAALLDGAVAHAAAGRDHVERWPIAPEFVGHRRCTTGEGWLYGIRIGLGSHGPASSFHPNEVAHAALSRWLAGQLRQRYSGS